MVNGWWLGVLVGERPMMAEKVCGQRNFGYCETCGLTEQGYE